MISLIFPRESKTRQEQLLINLNLLISFRNAVAKVASKCEFIRRQGQRFSRIKLALVSVAISGRDI